MMDYKIISPKLEKLQGYLTYLKGYQKYSLEEFKKDHTLQGAALHYLQLAIESALDIGEMLISGLRLRKPEETREVFLILAEQKIISEEFAGHFAPAAGLRNILVHEYTAVDLDRIYDYLQNRLGDFDLYARKIAQFVTRVKT